MIFQVSVDYLPMAFGALIMCACMAFIVTTADSYLLVSVQTVVSDLGKTFHPAMKEKQEILFSRIASVVLALGALVIACTSRVPTTCSCSPGPSTQRRRTARPGGSVLEESHQRGIMAGMLGGFVVTVVWKLVGEPMGLGATVPGAIACGVLLVGVSLATYRKRPTVMVEVK